MSCYQAAMGTALIALGATVTLGLQNVLRTGTAADAVVAVVHGQDIRQSDVDLEAGCELREALTRAEELRHAAREYLIGEALISVEAVQSNRTYREIFATEITARVPPIPEEQVHEIAVTYASGSEPTPELLSTVRYQLEREAVRRRLDRYLADLSAKYQVARRAPASEGSLMSRRDGVDAVPCSEPTPGRTSEIHRKHESAT